jgi:hypothetical protein
VRDWYLDVTVLPLNCCCYAHQCLFIDENTRYTYILYNNDDNNNKKKSIKCAYNRMNTLNILVISYYDKI